MILKLVAGVLRQAQFKRLIVTYSGTFESRLLLFVSELPQVRSFFF
jgi:hypothetical protein